MAQVKVEHGILEGEVIDNVFGGSYYSFKGIPYAAPPIGDLRFKAPQPLKPWPGIRSAKEHGPICYQFDSFTKLPPSGSEDCLYLNVYTPQVNPEKNYPVMVFIHGGAFVSGSGNSDRYGPEFIVNKDVILVTINYRVEALGFLCLDTEDIPGNAGMKDQVAALKWVKKNIKMFGGDPDNVTIFGESAGAASCTFHLVSSMSKGLFKRAIAQSGTATCWWSQPFEPRQRAIALARKLGFDSEDDKELARFFKSQPLENLFQINVPITFSEKVRESKDLQFGVVSEKRFDNNEVFFSGDIFDTLRNSKHEGVEVINGYCEYEGLIGLIEKDIQKIIIQGNIFLESFVPKPIALNCSMKDQFEVGRRIKEFYFEKENITEHNLEKLVKYYSMSSFIYGAIVWQKLWCKSSSSASYLYKFKCESERNILGHMAGIGKLIGKTTVVTHADDLAYLFHMKLLPKLDVNSKVYRMVDNVVALWTNFAKHGIPTPDKNLDVLWSPYTLDQQQYLNIGEELKPDSFPDEEEFAFWEKLLKKYLPHMAP